jgi:hypothetical protein
MPVRIQRRRVKGWTRPEGAVIVDRTSRWGNPFAVGGPVPMEYGGGEVIDRCDAVALYRVWLRRHPEVVEAARRELAGRDLACWCPLPRPGETDWCHAAVLLTVAAGGEI